METNRRSFLTDCSRLAVAGGLASAPLLAADNSAGSELGVTGNAAQTDDGVVIHPPDDLDMATMNGFPPTPGSQVTLENHPLRHEHLRWAHQHMQEFFPTQRVWRGHGPVSVFPANTGDCQISGSATPPVCGRHSIGNFNGWKQMRFC